MPREVDGGALDRSQRQSRIIALNACSRERVPKSWVAAPWPQPINRDGGQTGCRKRSGEIEAVEFEGRTLPWINLAVEAASGVRLRPDWQLIPQHCDDPSCRNPHHWIVVYDDANLDQLPPERKAGSGFVPLSSR